jgi:CheY-like chemotaxis protein
VACILVIDDDHAVLETIKMLLERDGHDVVGTDDGRKGLDLLRNGTFDLLIVDIFMPAMDGLETMKQVHRDRPEIPVIVISGYAPRPATESAPDFLQMATKLGAVSSLQKPFKPRDLLSVVGSCLSTADRLPPASAAARKVLSPD